MTIFEIILLAAALSIDSMAVSFSGAVSMGALKLSRVSTVAASLAVIQTAFLLGGYCAGDAVAAAIRDWGKYIAFSILLILGTRAIREAHSEKSDEEKNFNSFWRILAAGVATSIDAIAAGASFGLTCLPGKELWTIAAATFIATAAFAVTGMCCGTALGKRWERPAKICAGIILILIGVRIIII